MRDLLNMIEAAREAHVYKDVFDRELGEIFHIAAMAKSASDMPLARPWSDVQCVIFSEIVRLKNQS